MAAEIFPQMTNLQPKQAQICHFGAFLSLANFLYIKVM